MHKFTLTIVAAGMLAMLAAPANAQQRQGGGGRGAGGFRGDPVMLLSQESVQKELKLSAEQTKQVNELTEKIRESFRQGRDAGGGGDVSREERMRQFQERQKANREAAAKILNEEQNKRLRQISLQQRGMSALVDEEVGEAMKLGSETKEKVESALREMGEKMREIGRDGAEGAREKFQEMRKELDAKLLAMLSPEQQAKWKELTGEPFTGEIRAPQFGGGGRGRPNN